MISSQQIGEVKINYLHVPAMYNPKVFEMNDDIILQYETTYESDEELKNPLAMDKNVMNMFKTNVEQIIGQ